ncbi:type I restriction enzyme HsdR N-terminal domain-containing protein [Agrobacterium sp. rho-8.1]|nr:type I restriction enzyme HsdR N-terminal domain-containing protein [Agrobacterium sp. rho-8.1]
MKPISDRAKKEVNTFNEAEVRMHIIDPVLRELGYMDTDGTYLRLEEQLSYPYYYIGRKNKKKDVPLGKPDYRAGLLGRGGSFVIEAKAANVDLTREELEQAHSYAAHAEVRAQYFMVSNGRELRIYETLSAFENDPLVSLDINEINEEFHRVENILSPSNLGRLSRRTYDLDLKLANNRGSKIRIRDGKYSQQQWSYRIMLGDADITEQARPLLGDVDKQLTSLRDDFELRVGDGTIARNSEGRITADIQFIGATVGNDNAMKLLGFDQIVFLTEDKFLSSDPDNPSIFESTKEIQVKRGTVLPQMFGDAVSMGLDVQVSVYVKSRMFIDGSSIFGDFLALADYFVPVPVPGIGEIRIEFDFSGDASLRLME